MDTTYQQTQIEKFCKSRGSDQLNDGLTYSEGITPSDMSREWELHSPLNILIASGCLGSQNNTLDMGRNTSVRRKIQPDFYWLHMGWDGGLKHAGVSDV